MLFGWISCRNWCKGRDGWSGHNAAQEKGFPEEVREVSHGKSREGPEEQWPADRNLTELRWEPQVTMRFHREVKW